MSRDTWAFLAQAGLEATRIPRLIFLCGILVLLLLVSMHVNAQTVPAGTPAVTPASLATPGTEWLFDAALGADMLQSLQIHRTGLVETNSVLGPRANEAQIVGYFVGMGVIHYLATRELIRQHVPSSIVQMWETGTIGLELAYVKHNASLGVHFYVP
jgi:hypothetical protein